MVNKPPIQKAIFKALSGKKALCLDVLIKEVEKSLPKLKNDQKKAYSAIVRSIKNLTSDGLLEKLESDLQPYYRLSGEGRKKLNSNSLDDNTTLTTNTWDGYWRIIILDLPENRKSEREALRYLLKKAGFLCIKNSVWISIHPYEHLFTNIKKDLNLTSEMMIIVTNQIDPLTEKQFLLNVAK